MRAESVTQGVGMNIGRQPIGHRNLLDDPADAASG
jgi:hypothetical protein